MNDLIRGLNTYDDCEVKQSVAVGRRETISETLEAKKARLEIQLADVNEALAGLKAHPEVEMILNQITKVSRY